MGSAGISFGYQLTVGGSGTGSVVLTDGGRPSSTSGSRVVVLGESSSGRGTLNIGDRSGEAAAAPGIVDLNQIIGGDCGGVVVCNHTSTNYYLSMNGAEDGALMWVHGDTSFRMESGVTTIRDINTIYGGLARTQEHDAIDVTGMLELGGALRIPFVNEFIPAEGDTFAIFGGGFTSSSDYAIIIMPAGYEGVFKPTTGLLAIIPVPEPSTLLLAMLARGLVCAQRRRRAPRRNGAVVVSPHPSRAREGVEGCGVPSEGTTVSRQRYRAGILQGFTLRVTLGVPGAR